MKNSQINIYISYKLNNFSTKYNKKNINNIFVKLVKKFKNY